MLLYLCVDNSTPILNLIHSQTGISIKHREGSDYLFVSANDKTILLDKEQSEKMIAELSEIVKHMNNGSEEKTD